MAKVKISKYKGVDYINSVIPLKKPWRATVSGGRGQGGTKYLGVFKSEEEAALEYNEYALKRGMETNLIREVKYVQ